jgi:hypothetical protein
LLLASPRFSTIPFLQKSTLLPKSNGVSPVPYPGAETFNFGVEYVVGAGISMYADSRSAGWSLSGAVPSAGVKN